MTRRPAETGEGDGIIADGIEPFSYEDPGGVDNAPSMWQTANSEFSAGENASKTPLTIQIGVLKHGPGIPDNFAIASICGGALSC
jgi:hypothetical protein